MADAAGLTPAFDAFSKGALRASSELDLSLSLSRSR